MAYQTELSTNMGEGWPGNVVRHGPRMAVPGLINSATETNNVLGRALTNVDGQDGVFQVGGEGTFAGILTGQPQYATRNGLVPLDYVANGSVVEAMRMCPGVIVYLTTAGDVGDAIAYTATGEIVAAPDNTAPASSTLIEGSAIISNNIPAAGIAIVELKG